ncbi:MAG: family Rossman fold protein, partial [Paucimonas sp.]|nr:family Rossman fold protein [Paucimonas sp.]
LARAMVRQDISLVYGGGNVGLMGIIADEVLALGGKAIGVIPQALMDHEVGHQGLTELHVVKDMHERKALMAELADGFVALPGGIGTLEELFEALTWAQLGYHRKPVGLLNTSGFYDKLSDFLAHLVTSGFLKPAHAALLIHADDPDALLSRFLAYEPGAHERVLNASQARKILP